MFFEMDRFARLVLNVRGKNGWVVEDYCGADADGPRANLRNVFTGEQVGNFPVNRLRALPKLSRVRSPARRL